MLLKSVIDIQKGFIKCYQGRSIILIGTGVATFKRRVQSRKKAVRQESDVKHTSDSTGCVSTESLLQACQSTQEDRQHFAESDATIPGKSMSLTMMHVSLPTER